MAVSRRHACKICRPCISHGILERLRRTSGSTASPSRKPPPFSPIRSRGSMTIPNIQSASTESSSSAIQHPSAFCWYSSRNAARLSGSSAHGERTPESATTMRKTSRKRPVVSSNRVAASRRTKRTTAEPSMKPHYDFDYAKSKPNRFASRFTQGAVAVVLDPDVASVFQSSEAVNTFLRSAIEAMPASESSKRKRAS